jgi:hypothetical protein
MALKNNNTHATKCAIDGWIGFNHVVISRGNGHKTCDNFPFVQKDI